MKRLFLDELLKELSDKYNVENLKVNAINENGATCINLPVCFNERNPEWLPIFLEDVDFEENALEVAAEISDIVDKEIQKYQNKTE